jgi:hypothetical protein
MTDETAKQGWGVPFRNPPYADIGRWLQKASERYSRNTTLISVAQSDGTTEEADEPCDGEDVNGD